MIKSDTSTQMTNLNSHIPYVIIIMKSFFDVYWLGKKLHAGSYGTVYECVRKDTLRTFAVKRVSHVRYAREYPKYTIAPDAVRELYILSLARGHPYIVQMHDWFVEQQHTFIVMELAISDIRKLHFDSDESATRCMYALIESVRFLHSLGIRYRDVKSTNLLVFKDDCYKLCDFGMCGFATDTTQNVQSIWWRAPEQLRREAHTYASDAWSVGILCNDIYHREYTFTSKDERELERLLLAFESSHPVVGPLTQYEPADRASLDSIIALPFFDSVRKDIHTRDRITKITHQYTAHIQEYIRHYHPCDTSSNLFACIEWLVEQYVREHGLLDGIERITYAALIVTCKLRLSSTGKHLDRKLADLHILHIEKNMIFILTNSNVM